jgi:hypothetical protein
MRTMEPWRAKRTAKAPPLPRAGSCADGTRPAAYGRVRTVVACVCARSAAVPATPCARRVSRRIARAATPVFCRRAAANKRISRAAPLLLLSVDTCMRALAAALGAPCASLAGAVRARSAAAATALQARCHVRAFRTSCAAPRLTPPPAGAAAAAACRRCAPCALRAAAPVRADALGAARSRPPHRESAPRNGRFVLRPLRLRCAPRRDRRVAAAAPGRPQRQGTRRRCRRLAALLRPTTLTSQIPRSAVCALSLLL